MKLSTIYYNFADGKAQSETKQTPKPNCHRESKHQRDGSINMSP
jgi:hypothetical protein